MGLIFTRTVSQPQPVHVCACDVQVCVRQTWNGLGCQGKPLKKSSRDRIFKRLDIGEPGHRSRPFMAWDFSDFAWTCIFDPLFTFRTFRAIREKKTFSKAHFRPILGTFRASRGWYSLTQPPVQHISCRWGQTHPLAPFPEQIIGTRSHFGALWGLWLGRIHSAGSNGTHFHSDRFSGRVELFNFDPDPRQRWLLGYWTMFERGDIRQLEMQKASFINMYVPCTSQICQRIFCRHTVWSLIIGGFFTWISVYGINQTQVQRYLTVKTRSQAVRWETFICVPIAAFDLPSSPHCLQGNLVQCSGNRMPVTSLWLWRHGNAFILSLCSWWLNGCGNVAMLQNVMLLVAILCSYKSVNGNISIWLFVQAMYAYYHDCDPMTTRQVNKKDQLFPLFVMQVATQTHTKRFFSNFPNYRWWKTTLECPGCLLPASFPGLSPLSPVDSTH